MSRKKMNKDEKKPILTININENLLLKLDKLIEESGDKRSRIIEKLLEIYINDNKDKLI